MRCFLILSIALALSYSALHAQDVRKPEVAGAFYPADARALTDSIALYTKGVAHDSALHGRVFGIIAPHAGYIYSGRTQARSYQALSGHHYTTAIIIGPSHRGTFDGAALHHALAWETPLGRLQVDTSIERAIARACPFVKIIDSAFDKEHSVEDQLPFVQQTLGNARIVPIACGAMDLPQLLTLGRTLARLASDSLVIIASSDMSHYQTLSRTLARDWLATQDILAMDPEKTFADIIQTHTCELCGYAPVVALMFAAEAAGCDARVLGYSNSVWATGDTTRVVGYGAFSFTAPEPFTPIDTNDQRTLLRLARMTVDSLVIKGRTLNVQAGGPVFGRLQGAFVTLKKKGVLRGCIGYMAPTMPLAQSISQAAISACAKDERFTPVTASELKDVTIEISTLGPMRRVRTMDDIMLGTTGLVIELSGKRGVLLPQVATEFGWTKEEFLKQLALKAGLLPDDWKSPTAKIYSFTAQVFRE